VYVHRGLTALTAAASPSPPRDGGLIDMAHDRGDPDYTVRAFEKAVLDSIDADEEVHLGTNYLVRFTTPNGSSETAEFYGSWAVETFETAVTDAGGSVHTVERIDHDPAPETAEIGDKTVPKRLADFYRADEFGLVSVRPGSPDGVIVYERASRVGGDPAIEIPHEDPHLVDESDVPGGSKPPTTFEKLVDDYGLATTTTEGHTYVYDPEWEGDD